MRFLAPVIPTKVVAVGKNYVDHAAEMDSGAIVRPAPEREMPVDVPPVEDENGTEGPGKNIKGYLFSI